MVIAILLFTEQAMFTSILAAATGVAGTIGSFRNAYAMATKPFNASNQREQRCLAHRVRQSIGHSIAFGSSVVCGAPTSGTCAFLSTRFSALRHHGVTRSTYAGST